MSQTHDFSELSPARARARNLTVLAASTLTVMAGATLSPALPAMQRHFADTPNVEWLVKLVMSLPGFTIAVGAPLVGMVVDRSRKKPLIVASLLLFAVAGSSGFFSTDSLYGILLGRALLGLSVAGVMTGCTTLVAEYFRGPALSHFMGIQASVSGFGAVGFVLLGGVLAGVGFEYPFLLYVAGFLLIPAVIYCLPESTPRSLASPAGASPAALPAAPTLPLALVSLCFALAFVEILYLYMIPLHYPFYVEAFGAFSSAQVGMAISFLLLVMASVAALYRRLAGRFSFAGIHALGLTLLGLGFVLLGSVRAYASTYLALAIAGMGFGVLRPNLMVWLLSATPMPLRGRVIGGVTTFFFLGQFVCPVLTEPLALTMGLPRTFQVAGALAMVFALSFALATLRAPSAAEPSQT